MSTNVKSINELKAMPPLLIDTPALGNLLVRHGVVQDGAVNDSENYDGCHTVIGVAQVCDAINTKLEPTRNAIPHLLAIAEAAEEHDWCNDTATRNRLQTAIDAARAAGLFGEVGG